MAFEEPRWKPLTSRPPLPRTGEGEPDSTAPPPERKLDTMPGGVPSPAHGRGGRGVRDSRGCARSHSDAILVPFAITWA